MTPAAVRQIRSIETQIENAELILVKLRTWSTLQERKTRALENRAQHDAKRATDVRKRARDKSKKDMIRNIARWASALMFLALTIGAATWIAHKMRSTERWTPGEVADPERAKRIRTPYIMIRRIVVPVIYIVGTVVVLIHFEVFRQWGLTFLASAGVASVVFGLAARGSFENFIAGLTLCFSQTIRIEDTVKIDGEFGTIEDIGLMYTTFKVWDNRRILIPNEALARKNIENYTIRGTELLVKVPFHLDHEADLERAADALKAVVRASSHWSGREEPQVWFMETTERAIEIWVAGWAKNSSEGWALRSEVLRNGLHRLRQEGIPLPRTRLNVEQEPPAA